MSGQRILVVDDEPGVRTALESILRDEGFEVVCAESGEEGLRVAAGEEFDAILLDVWLPGMDGLEALRRMRERRTDAEVVMISGHGTIDTAVRATKLGAFDFVEKPLSLEKTLLVLRNALRQRRLERRNRDLLRQIAGATEVVGESAAAVGLRREIDIAAGTDAPVLIVGGRGSGREQVARRIHMAGTRPGGAFVALSAGALDAEAAEKALFGLGGGPGRLELARGGTFFVENAELLDRRVRRRLVGWWAEQAREVDPVRLMASTGATEATPDPELLEIVDVVRVRVPPLRERREDIEALVERTLARLAREYGRPVKRFDAGALAALKVHDWPGNVRELERLMERLFLASPGEEIGSGELPEALGGARPPAEDLYGEFDSLAAGVAAFERYFIARALHREQGRREAAAKSLGMSPEELDAKLG